MQHPRHIVARRRRQRNPVIRYTVNGVTYDTAHSALLAAGSLAETRNPSDGRQRIWLYRTGDGEFFAVNLRTGPASLTVHPLPAQLARLVYQACELRAKEWPAAG